MTKRNELARNVKLSPDQWSVYLARAIAASKDKEGHVWLSGVWLKFPRSVKDLALGR